MVVGKHSIILAGGIAISIMAQTHAVKAFDQRLVPNRTSSVSIGIEGDIKEIPLTDAFHIERSAINGDSSLVYTIDVTTSTSQNVRHTTSSSSNSICEDRVGKIHVYGDVHGEKLCNWATRLATSTRCAMAAEGGKTVADWCPESCSSCPDGSSASSLTSHSTVATDHPPRISSNKAPISPVSSTKVPKSLASPTKAPKTPEAPTSPAPPSSCEDRVGKIHVYGDVHGEKLCTWATRLATSTRCAMAAEGDKTVADWCPESCSSCPDGSSASLHTSHSTVATDHPPSISSSKAPISPVSSTKVPKSLASPTKAPKTPEAPTSPAPPSSCEDRVGKIYVYGDVHGEKFCKWTTRLATRQRCAMAAQGGKIVADWCPESCSSCPSSEPSSSPTKKPSREGSIAAMEKTAGTKRDFTVIMLSSCLGCVTLFAMVLLVQSLRNRRQTAQSVKNPDLLNSNNASGSTDSGTVLNANPPIAETGTVKGVGILSPLEITQQKVHSYWGSPFAAGLPDLRKKKDSRSGKDVVDKNYIEPASMKAIKEVIDKSQVSPKDAEAVASDCLSACLSPKYAEVIEPACFPAHRRRKDAEDAEDAEDAADADSACLSYSDSSQSSGSFASTKTSVFAQRIEASTKNSVFAQRIEQCAKMES